MLVYHKFPYTNFHELNLDWLLQKVKHLEDWAEQFEPDMIHEEIQNIINQMVEDGTFEQLFAEWIAPISEDVENLKVRVEALETSQDRQDFDIETLENALSNLSSTVNENYVELSEGLSGINVTVNNLSDSVTLISNTLDDLSNDYSHYKTTTNTTISDLHNDLSDLDSDYSTFKTNTESELSDHELRITALENSEPEPPNYLSRNNIYRGKEYSTLSTLLTDVENGATYIGDFCYALLPSIIGGSEIMYVVYVAQHLSANSAFLLLRPLQYTLVRGSPINYYNSPIRTSIIAVSNALQPNFNYKLVAFDVCWLDGRILSESGALMSSIQYFGTPAYDLSSYDSNTIFGKLPFVEYYLGAGLDVMLMDDDSTTFAIAKTSTSSPHSRLYYGDANTLSIWTPFIVKYQA